MWDQVWRWLLFCPEVIARGHEAAPTLPTSRVSGAHPRGLLSQAQAKAGRAPGLGGIPRLVQPARMDRRPAAGPAPAGALVPGVCPAWRSHPGHRGGPCHTPPGRLADVHRPGQPSEPVRALSQSEDRPGAGGRTQKKKPFSRPLRQRSGGTLGRPPALPPRPHAGAASRRLAGPFPQCQKVLGGGAKDRAPPSV